MYATAQVCGFPTQQSTSPAEPIRFTRLGSSRRVDAWGVEMNTLTSRGTIRKNELHGMTKTPEHQAWSNMIHRCSNPNVPNYHVYGGRGIRVCKEWINSFSSFIPIFAAFKIFKFSAESLGVVIPLPNENNF